MNDSLNIPCPHCGESFLIRFDPSEGATEFTYDCEICCRPMKVSVRVDDSGELLSLDIVEE